MPLPPSPTAPVMPNRLAQVRKMLDARNGAVPQQPPMAPQTPVQVNPAVAPGAAPAPAAPAPYQRPTPDHTKGAMAPGGPGGTPAPTPAAPADLNTQEDDFIKSLISGAGGDPAQEALIKQIFEDKMGADTVDQRARGGRFGAMGAQAALEGDVRRQDAQQESAAMAAARQQGVTNALAGLQGDATIEQTRANDAILRQILGLAQGDANAPAAGTEEGGTGTGTFGGSAYDGPTGRDGVAAGAKAAASKYPGGPDAFDAASQSGHTAATKYSVDHGGDFSGLPEGKPSPTSVLAAKDPASGDAVYFDPATGKLFRVKK